MCCPHSWKDWLVFLFPNTAVVLNLFCPDFCSLETVYVRQPLPPVSGTSADQATILQHRPEGRVVLHWETGEKQTPDRLCVQLTFKSRDAGVYLVKPPHCWCLHSAAGAGAAPAGGEEGCKTFPVRGVLFLRRYSLTFGGT